MAEVFKKNAGQAIITCRCTLPGSSAASQFVHCDPIDCVTNGAGPRRRESTMPAR